MGKVKTYVTCLKFLCNILDVLASCCNHRCVKIGDELDCDSKCINRRLCALDSDITRLIYSNNNAPIDVTFPFSPHLKELDISNNGWTQKIPLNSLLANPNLIRINLTGNKLKIAGFGSLPIHLKLREMIGLEAEYMDFGTFMGLSALEKLEVTIHGKNFNESTLHINVKELILTLADIDKLEVEKLKNIKNVEALVLNMPRITELKRYDLKYFWNIQNLTLIADNLMSIEDKILTSMEKLKRLAIKAPILDIFPVHLLRIDNITKSSLEHVEFCPILNIPHLILVGRNPIISFKMCNTIKRAVIGMPVERTYKTISLLNGGISTRRGSVFSSTLFSVQGNKAMLGDDVKIRSKSVELINMTVHNFQWSQHFDLSMIRELNLKHNHLNAITYFDFLDLTYLEKLNVANNKIKVIEYFSLRALRKLNMIDVSFNNLVDLDLSLFYSGILKVARFNDNKIKTVSPALRELAIEQLFLENNYITSINTLFESGQNIKSITLNNNLITHIPHRFPRSLTKFDLRDNLLHCECEAIMHVNNLTEQLIQNDQLRVVSSVKFLKCNDASKTNLLTKAASCVNNTRANNINVEYKVDEVRDNDHFLAPIGTLIRYKAKLVAGNDVVTASVHIPLHRLKLPPDINLLSLKSICANVDSFQFNTKQFCDDYSDKLERADRKLGELRNTINKKAIEINYLAFNDHEIAFGRQKRFITPAFQSITQIGIKLGIMFSEFINNKRIKAMNKALHIVQANTITNKKDILAIKKDLALYHVKSAENYMKMYNRISAINNDISDMRRASVAFRNYVSQFINSTVIDILSKTEQLAVISETRAKIDATRREYLKFKHIYEQMIDAVIMLKRGILSPHLVSPIELSKIIREAKILLQQQSSNSKLVFQNVDHYYKVSDTGYLSNKHLGIIVNVNFFITQITTDFLELYEFSFISVPLAKDKKTRLISRDKMIAILNQEYYQTFSQQEFQRCKSYYNQNVYICPFQLQLRHRNSPNCEASIYFSRKLSEIYDNCDVQLIPDSDDNYELIQFDNKILMSHVHPPIKWSCKKQIGNETNTQVLDQIILSRNALCGCSLETKDFFIPERSCPKNNETAQIHYIANAIAFQGLNSTNESYSEEFLMKWHDSKPVITYPDINITTLAKRNLIDNLDDEVILDFKEVMKVLKQDPEVELTVADKINNMRHLFLGRFKIIGISAVLSGSGLMALFCILIICKRQSQLRKLIYGIIVSMWAPKSEAKDNLMEIEDWDDYIKSLAVMVLTLAIIHVVHILFSWFTTMIKTSVPRLELPKALQKPGKTILFLILKTYDDQISIPLCEILAQPDNIKLQNSFEIQDISIQRIFLRYYLKLSWNVDQSTLLIESLKINLPPTIPVSFSLAKKINKVKNADMFMKLLLLDHTNQVHVLSSRIFSPLEFQVVDKHEITFRERKRFLLKQLDHSKK